MKRKALSILALVVSIAIGAAAGIAGARYTVAWRLRAAGEKLNGWNVNFNYGRFESDLLLRAGIAKVGIGANQAEESVYYSAQADSDGRALDGRSNYVLHFAADAPPPVDAFWSASVISADDLFFVENPIQRYAIGDRTKGLKRNPDGSLDILIQHDQPTDDSANWLPCPAGKFVVVFRAYEPRTEILTRRWAPPPLRRAERLA